MAAGVVDADDLFHVRLGLVAEQGAVAILIGLKERVVELAASLAAVERGIKRTGLDKVLEEVAAVAQLRAQTVGAVGQLAQTVEVRDLGIVHRHTERRRRRAPAAGPHQHGALVAQKGVEPA